MEPSTVPDVLGRMIAQRTCPALNEFYEVILKAYDAGILHEGKNVPFRRHAVRWFVSLPVYLTLVVSVVALLAALVAMILHEMPTPSEWQDYVWGWLAMCIGLSAGYAVAASVLSAGDNEVYRPHFHWQTLVPHFALDLRDVRMASSISQLAAEYGRFAPLAIIATAALLMESSWSLFPVVALLVVLRPVDGLFGRTATLLRRRPRLDTDYHLLFTLNHEPGRRLKIVWRQFDWRATAAELGFGLGWALLTANVIFHLLHISIRATLCDIAYWKMIAPYLVGAVALVGLGWCAHEFWPTVRTGLRTLVSRSQQRWQRWHANVEPTYTEATIRQLIARNPLLRRLDTETQAELAHLLRPFTTKAFRPIISSDESFDQVGLIASGFASAYHRLKSGRRAFAFYLSEGDIFGVNNIVDGHSQQLEVRSKTPVFAFVLSAADFERLVVSKLGAEMVYNLTHKVPFLARLSLCAHWGPQAIARFAQLSQMVKYHKGDVVLRENDDVQAFYIVYEGSVRAMHGSKRLSKIRRGGFFGEISLLQNGAASASLVANEETLCLALSKADFLRFVRHNYYVALTLERISSKRLGRPIFPLNPHSIDAYKFSPVG
ncbi:MAG TPA: cyclic nucleotide-binding domain-containing protein [Opitutaceae bacterium]|nr:cyclic nucleotide-binding domain-containing protein [Opitutaceae bacterium]